MSQLPPNITNLTNYTGQNGLFIPYNSFIKKGDLISFFYEYWKNDFSPLLIVSDSMLVSKSGNMMRGVNLHYLTFPYIRNLLQNNKNNPNFSYSNIKGNQYLTDAFRSYKLNAVTNIKKLDVNFILNVMATVRTFDPNQVKAIRESIQEQIQRKINPTFEDLQQQGVPQTGVVQAPAETV